MAVDDRFNNTVSFGGRALDGLSAITLVYDNASNGTWWYAGSPVSPSARANASFASYSPGGLAVLFGGLGNLSNLRTLNDTWAYYFGNETWVNVSQAIAPPARENAAFAIDPVAGVGLLVGGIDPRFSSGGTTGTILWNDSWELNLTTMRWTPLSLGGSPPALYGSSMVWDPVVHEFVLFGGCDTARCSDSVWTYSPGSSQWSHPTVGGVDPGGRGSAAFVWDPVDNVSVLYGGFAPGAAGPAALGGTYSLDPTLTGWSVVGSVGGPPPTYGAASAFSDYPGCVGMWVQGGSPALDGVITNDSLLEPVSSLRPNCFTPFGGGTGNGPPPACSNVSAHVSIQVRDAFTGAGLTGADVVVSGGCGTSHGTTRAAGFVNLTEAAPDVLTVTADRIGYHGGTITTAYTGAAGEIVYLNLYPFPALSARVFGSTAQGTFPLADAAVSVGGALIVGSSDSLGWVNATSIPSNGSTVTVGATAPDFSAARSTVPLPYTGVVEVNLTLLAYGSLDLRVRDNWTAQPIGGATLSLTFLDPLGANTTVVRTDSSGWFNSSLEAGNYTVDAGAPGYFSNGTAGGFYHGWVVPTVLVVNLSKVYGADVDVHLLNAATGNPVAQGRVTFGGALSVYSDTRGWANATNLQPEGLLRILVSAWGFYPNTTTVTIAPYVILRDVMVALHPAPPCSPYADCSLLNASAPPPALSLLPPPGAVRTVLLGAPLALAALGVAFVAYHRWRTQLRSPRSPDLPAPPSPSSPPS